MGEIKIIGTAHVSLESVQEVRQAIEELRPDVVAIELDSGRFSSLRKEGLPPTVETILESKNFSGILFQWILAYLQHKIGIDVGVEPGAEMRAAIEESEVRGIPIALIDRDIRLTLHRFLGMMRPLEKMKLFFNSLISLVNSDKLEEETISALNIESLKEESTLNQVIEDFRSFSPNAARTLIDERDAFMSHRLIQIRRENPEALILAIVGAGHKRGMTEYLAHPQNLPTLESLTVYPRSIPWSKIFAVAVTGIFCLIVSALALSGCESTLILKTLLFWILSHGVLAASGALIARGHPSAILTALGVAGFTSLIPFNPILKVGFISAYVQAKMTKPQGSDFQRIYKAASLGEMVRIPLFKVVLVGLLTHLGSFLATILFFVTISPVLGIDPTDLVIRGLENIWHLITG